MLLLPLEALRRFRALSRPRSFSPDSLAAPLSLERSLGFSSERSLRLVGEGALRGEEECESACASGQALTAQPGRGDPERPETPVPTELTVARDTHCGTHFLRVLAVAHPQCSTRKILGKDYLVLDFLLFSLTPSKLFFFTPDKSILPF